MGVFGIGIDIVDNNRIKKLLFNKKLKFKNKIFTKKEIAYCQKKTNIINCFSKRFAAKEAFVKALGIGFRKKILCKKPSSLINEFYHKRCKKFKFFD